jgi:hypothetical protein
MWNLISIHLDARYVHGLRQTYLMLGNHFGRTRWNSLVMRLNWKLVLVHLEIVLILTQDRCMVCAERTIGLQIVLDTPDGDVVSVGAREVYDLRQTFYRLRNRFGHTRWYC